MQGLCANRVHNLARQEDAREGAFVARAARFLLHARGGRDVVPDYHDLRRDAPAAARPARALSRLAVAAAERPLRSAPCARGQKRGLLIGMGMTEKQGGLMC